MSLFNNISNYNKPSLGTQIKRNYVKTKSKSRAPIYENNESTIYENNESHIYENNVNNENPIFYPNPKPKSIANQLNELGLPNNNASDNNLNSIFLNKNNTGKTISNNNNGQNIANKLKKKKHNKKWSFFKKVKNLFKRNKKSKKKEKKKSVKSKSVKKEPIPVPNLSDVFSNNGRKWKQYTKLSNNKSNTPLGLSTPPLSQISPHPNSMTHFQRSKSPQIFKRGNSGLIRNEKKRILNKLAKSVLSNKQRSKKLGNEPELLQQKKYNKIYKKTKIKKNSYKKGKKSPLSKNTNNIKSFESHDNYQPIVIDTNNEPEIKNNVQLEDNQFINFNENYMCNRANRSTGKKRKRLNCMVANLKGHKCYWDKEHNICIKKKADYPCSKYNKKKCNSKKENNCYWTNNSCKSKKNLNYPCNEYNEVKCKSKDGHKNKCYWKGTDIDGYPIKKCKKQLGDWRKLN
jgi:hypothetical protein